MTCQSVIGCVRARRVHKGRTGVVDKAFPTHGSSAYSVGHGTVLTTCEKERIYTLASASDKPIRRVARNG